jgi:L-aspartate oxidase
LPNPYWRHYKKGMKSTETDVLILGSGLAGLATALKLAENSKVTLITKDRLRSANTSMAQGGIAAVSSSSDSFEAHIDDTQKAGAGLCIESVVSQFIRQGPARIQDLIKWGVRFDTTGKKTNSHFEMDLTQEGGHSYRRILHFEDQTGAEIHRALLEKAKAHPNITLLENEFAIDLLVNKQLDQFDMSPTRCVGCYSLNTQTSEVSAFLAKSTVLATGGAGKVYLYTTNWERATGDGIALAYRAGARIANLEFMQFHPTCLYHPEARNFLVSEAVRGEGGELINERGEAFMKKYHPLGSLAPRDIVSRSIDAEMKKSGSSCVYLDIRHRGEEYLKQRFPLIYQRCLDLGINMSQQPIPVVPAAHYLCGGVWTNANGKTDIAGLWAVGETACTGFHGANRLASNSLLECLIMAENCSHDIISAVGQTELTQIKPPPWTSPNTTNDDEMIVISHMWSEIRHLMWNYVGIVRSTKRLERAQSRLKNILAEVKDNYSNFKLHSDILELRNIAIVADLTVACALKRKESRGIHYNLDYPETSEAKEQSFVIRGLNS